MAQARRHDADEEARASRDRTVGPAGATWADPVVLPDEPGPFFHGTGAAVSPGDLLVAGRRSNHRPEVVVNHVCFTALREGAGLAAELAVLLGGGDPHVDEVEPTGPFEDDPNVTDRRFPGNPTRSFRSTAPLRVVREVHGWTRLTPEAVQQWTERLTVLRETDAEIVD